MEKSIGQPKKVKTKSGRAGSFFLGTFIGFLLTIALLAGLFSFVYFKLSADWVNKHFKTNINLPYELNSLTLNDAVVAAINLGKNIDTYTLNDLEKDFGINVKDKLFGIDISDLKSVAFKDLSTGISDKFKSISANELEGVVSLPESLNNFLDDNSNTYFVNGTKLFTDDAHLHEVTDFEYTVDTANNQVKIKSICTSLIENGQVKITLKYLPISVAFSSLNFSEDMTIEDLEKYVELPDFLSGLDKTTPLNQLSEEIEKLKIAKLLGYEIDEDGKVYKDSTRTEEVSKIEATLAKKTISDLKGGLTLKLGDMFDDSDFNSGLLKLLSGSKETTLDKLPEELDDKIKNANLNTLKDIGFFDSGDFDSGILSLLTDEERNSCTITNLAETLETKVGNATLGDLVKAKIITDSNAAAIMSKKIKTKSHQEGEALSDMKLTDFLNLLFTDSEFSDLIFVDIE